MQREGAIEKNVAGSGDSTVAREHYAQFLTANMKKCRGTAGDKLTRRHQCLIGECRTCCIGTGRLRRSLSIPRSCCAPA